MSKFAGILPRKFIRFRHSGIESLTAGPESRGGDCSDLPPTEKSTEDVLIIAAIDTPPAKTMTMVKTVSEGPMESARET